MSLLLNSKRIPLLCYVTDRRVLERRPLLSVIRVAVEAGATGIAGISLFQNPNTCVEELQKLRREIVEAVEGTSSEVP